MQTQIIVLTKTPYRENDLIVNGVSPDAGRLSLLLNGARKVDAKRFPCADIFRELDVEYTPSDRSELFTVAHLELSADFSALADVTENFHFAGKIGAFLLRNSVYDLAMPLTYDCLKHVLANLASGAEAPWSLPECSVLIKLTYLYENGLLPGLDGDTPQEAKALELFEAIINAGIDATPMPECRPDYWPQLNHYLNSVIQSHQLPWK